MDNNATPKQVQQAAQELAQGGGARVAHIAACERRDRHNALIWVLCVVVGVRRKKERSRAAESGLAVVYNYL